MITTSFASSPQLLHMRSIFTNDESSMQFVNSNNLVRSSKWDIGVSKTGFLSEAGRCLVMQANITGRQLLLYCLIPGGRILVWETRIGSRSGWRLVSLAKFAVEILRIAVLAFARRLMLRGDLVELHPHSWS